MNPTISVIICTHNPRRNYLSSVLNSLQNQTLVMENWELLLIDNASDATLSLEIDLSWHKNAHHIREEQIGLTSARLRGIRESYGDFIVFVDDDNILNLDYLENALTIGQNYPLIGAWGGQIFPQFEEPPPEWTKEYWTMLALREFRNNQWSNLIHFYKTTPCGAGMCLRRVVANQYLELANSNAKRISLGRTGQSLVSFEDIDMALTACDLGLGTGQFVDLKLTHIIPKERLQEEYLLKLTEANAYSMLLMESFRGKFPENPRKSWSGKLLSLYRLWKMKPRERKFHQAVERGKKRAIHEINHNC